MAKLVIMDFMLIHGNDWFVIPLEQDVGTAMRIDRLAVTDVFGSTVIVPRAEEAGRLWTLFTSSTAGDPTQWEAGAQRTDAIMLVHLAADRKSAAAISIPRDSWVPIPGYGEAKINAAFSYGGPALMIRTVEDLTGVRIDHFAVTDFESFEALTDSLDGVEITVPDANAAGGTLVIPGHGRIADHAEVAYYRDMTTIVRDRIQDMIRKKMTLAQVKAARPTRDWDARYGTASGPWTTAIGTSG